MNAFIQLDNVPEWQMGKEVTVYFPDTMCKRGVCKAYKPMQYNGVKYDRCFACGSLINSVDNAIACGRCGRTVSWDATPL